MREHRGRTTAGWWWVGWLGVWWLVGGVPIAWAAEWMAMVIGNARYLNERPLVNTLNDARAVADQLRGLGFEVTLHEDLTAIPMRREINRYLEEVKGREGTVLFYYSGHGMQDRYRASYLIPVDAKVAGQEDIVAYGVGLNDILEKLGERPRDAVSLVIVDACRDNPFASQRGGKGLGRVEAGRGTLVLYAAGPGQTADDRPNEPNGLFTQHLLQVLPQPGLDLEDAFDRIAEAVERASNGQQVPYKEGDLRGKFYLAGPPPSTPPSTPPPVVDYDLIAWQSAEKCGTSACFRAYLGDYPKGRYARMALARLEPTSTPTPVITTQPTPAPPPAENLLADRYRDHGDGTVMDVRTGLQWMRCSLGQRWRGGTCTGTAKTYAWQAALDAADALNRQGGYTGHQDWRVPTKEELSTLIYCSSGQPKTWKDTEDYCGGNYKRPTLYQLAFPNALDSVYWSSSTHANHPDYGWGFNFHSGDMYVHGEANGFYVRLVRGGQ